MGCLEVGVGFDNCFGVYSCSCSTFFLYVSVNSGIDFYLILGSFLTFWALMGYFWGQGRVQKLFYVVLSILNFDFYLILGSFLTFWDPNGLFLGSG